ncbi:hypothetical protein YW5DRAFT_01914 [Streptomyces sp. Ncost-T6T-1]|uniref:hypothetical protein n=1 Tax=Streptomyces sp. Ncost-T6T-1 TaxID=1100828 RepID=UPI0008057D89|nr:hypothetical protein [Streptomyces sp. Ncost-T6T-1]SBV00587.1 hypothetical protein YW5DRAFT_01914 [Streptomyces sp. Ncost-T6T-1]
MKRDYLLWGALGAVLVVLASGEYELARACGFGTYVAAGVPAALDIYAVRALRAKRDVLVVVVALIAVNSASHLLAAGVLTVTPWLIVAVSSIAPLVLWRVHQLGEHTAPEPEPATAGSEPAEPGPVPVTVERAQAPIDAAPVGPVLGPWTPVPELVSGTTGTRAGTDPDQDLSRHWEEALSVAAPAPEPAGPYPVPPVPDPRPGAADLETADSGNTTFDRQVADARNWLKDDPELTGTAIGARLGKSDAYGRRIRRAALADA